MTIKTTGNATIKGLDQTGVIIRCMICLHPMRERILPNGNTVWECKTPKCKRHNKAWPK